MNYIDLIIILVLSLFAYLGYARGFIREFGNLVAIIAAIFLAAVSYIGVGAWLSQIFPMPSSIANTVGFFLVWFIVMFIYYAVMIFTYDLIPEAIRKSKLNRWFGILPSVIRGGLIIWFAINLGSLLLVAGQQKQILDGSFISRNLIKSDGLVGDFVNKTFGPSLVNTVKFLTVKPQGDERVALGYTTTNVTADEQSGKQMLEFVNKERTARGLRELVWDDKLAKVGEGHCRDMFTRGYFSHNTSEGKTPFDRMDAAGINYLIAGENLALAPTLDQAFTGLMNSPGHKANILSSDFGHVGIGAIDGGVYGKMFAQEFTN